MTYTDFVAELSRAGLGVRTFAELVGMNPNSVSNYARAAEVPTHLALIAVLLAELSIQGMDYRRAVAKVGPTPKRPRGRRKAGLFGGDPQVPLDFTQ